MSGHHYVTLHVEGNNNDEGAFEMHLNLTAGADDDLPCHLLSIEVDGVSREFSVTQKDCANIAAMFKNAYNILDGGLE